MKCPYQTVIIHAPETFDHYARESVTFSDCVKNECPFYYTKEHYKQDIMTHITEHCRRAESEEKG
jgi:hypothetical protein